MQNINYAFLLSRPVWGAWIEIVISATINAVFMSRPVWGAWIEISVSGLMYTDSGTSRPVWGAWIEIETVVHLEELIKGRARYGARGLKCA